MRSALRLLIRKAPGYVVLQAGLTRLLLLAQRGGLGFEQRRLGYSAIRAR